MVPCQSIVKRNTNEKYENPITSGLKVMAKVKVFVLRNECLFFSVHGI